MTSSATATYSYTTADIETVVRRFLADIVMIAQSTNAITEAQARDYAHDVEALATRGYLRMVDLSLLSGGVEVKATQYTVNTSAGSITMSRPGGQLWPRLANAEFRIILFYSDAYDSAARVVMRGRLKIGWVSTTADTSHSALTQSGGRDYASNGWGLQRTDFSR